MPYKVSKPCKFSGCSKLVSGSAVDPYCDEHKRVVHKQWDMERETAVIPRYTTRDEYHHLYSTHRWQRLRKWQLTNSPLCAKCEQIASVADHKIPHKGDLQLFWSRDNLQSLCFSCHQGVKKMEEIHGYSQSCGINGLSLDNKHPWNRKR